MPSSLQHHSARPFRFRLQASPQGAEGVWDRIQRTRPMRNALLLLLSLILAANCVWAVQGLAAWRRGHALGQGSEQQLMLQRLNATVLSVEVRGQGVGGRGRGQRPAKVAAGAAQGSCCACRVPARLPASPPLRPPAAPLWRSTPSASHPPAGQPGGGRQCH